MDSGPKWMSPTARQTWAVLPVLLDKGCLGMSLAFTSCFLATIQDPASTIKMDMATASWFVSILGTAMMVGCFIVSCIMYKWGRRVAYIVTCFPALVGLAVAALAEDVPALMAFRVITGASIGAYGVMVGVVIGEYSSPRNRAMFLNLSTATFNVGSLLVHLLGYYVSWRAVALLIPAPFLLCLVIAFSLPESPFWLAERKRPDDSRRAFYWLRGRTEETTREIDELIRAQQHKNTDRSLSDILEDFFLKFKKKNFLKPVFIMILSNLLIETSGRHIFPSYAAQLIKQFMSDGFHPFYSNVAIDVLVSVSNIAASYLIRIMRVRTLLFSTGFATFLSLGLACFSLYLFNNGTFSKDYSWVPLLFFALYLVLSNLGCSCIPILIGGEIFPLEHKIVGSMMNYYIRTIIMTVSLKVTPFVVLACTVEGAFAILTICMAIVLIALYFVLPETSNRTLQEIEDFFNYGKFRDFDVVPTCDDEHGVK